MISENKQNNQNPRPILLGLGIMWIILASAIIILQFAIPATIEIEWETETELDTAGFNIYRSERADGEYTRINERIIPSQSDAVSGAIYLYIDDNVERGKTYYYRLEDIEFDNSSQQHDILTGEVQGLNWWTIPLSIFSLIVGLIILSSGVRQSQPLVPERSY
jgi:hypothetical protein